MTKEPTDNTSAPAPVETVYQNVVKDSCQQDGGEDTNIPSQQPSASSSASVLFDNTNNGDNVDSSSANKSSDEESDALLASDSESDAVKEIECQPSEVRTTTSRHDDWLHRASNWPHCLSSSTWRGLRKYPGRHVAIPTESTSSRLIHITHMPYFTVSR